MKAQETESKINTMDFIKLKFRKNVLFTERIHELIMAKSIANLMKQMNIIYTSKKFN